MILLLVGCVDDRPDTGASPAARVDTDEELDTDTDVETGVWDSGGTETGGWDTAWTDTTECPADTENEWWVCNAVATYRGTRNLYDRNPSDWDSLDSIAGDFDGDGRLGLGISAPDSYRGTGLDDGLVYIENDIQPGVHRLADGDDLVYASGSNERLRLIAALDGTGDGVADGLFHEVVSSDLEAVVYLVPGPFDGERSVTQAVMTVTGGYDSLLRAAAASGDLDGDGVPEVMLTTARFQAAEGDGDAVVAFPGDATGAFVEEDAAWWVESPSGYPGASLVEDVTGDGVDDLIQGMPYADDWSGEVLSFEGPIREPVGDGDAIGVRIGGAEDQAGWDVALCDFNADGVPDLVTSAYTSDSYAPSAGVIWVDYGPLVGEGTLADAAIRITGTYELASMGKNPLAEPSPRGTGCVLVANASMPWRDTGEVPPGSLTYVWFEPGEGSWFSNSADVRVLGSFHMGGQGLVQMPDEGGEALRLLLGTSGNEGPNTVSVVNLE